MDLNHSLLLIGIALLLGLCVPGRIRAWGLLFFSGLVIFWLQPSSAVRGVGFWIPLLTLVISGGVWLIITPRELRLKRENFLAAGILVFAAGLAGLSRWVQLPDWAAFPRGPQALIVAGSLLTILTAGILLAYLIRNGKFASVFAIIFLIFLLIILKFSPFTVILSKGIRVLTVQSQKMASPVDIVWLGYSYLAFRLIHVLRDWQNHRLKPVSLRDFFVYLLFFPAFSAGPIDRLDRFQKDIQAGTKLDTQQVWNGSGRIVLGLVKKFVLADSLARIALNPLSAEQVHASGWMWMLVYAYGLQIFFDFSGYTDMAVGMGILLGIRLPENFNRPYLKTNLTLFWNSWHMSLTQWFRAYFFNPLTRSIRIRKPGIHTGWVILLTQVCTFSLIGLWHGITWNFLLWGLWHGLGLFLQNRWADFWKNHPLTIAEKIPTWLKNGTGWFLTFHYVLLGWVWFALPTPQLALTVFQKLLGGAG